MTANIGQVIPGYTTEQDRWKAGIHLSGAFNIGAEMRMNEHWSMGVGLGLTGFWLDNRGPFDNYILDFASPALTTGLQYLWRNHTERESFVRLGMGIQLGYQESFVEEYDGYEVFISSDQPVYYFIKPEIGFRKTASQKTKVSRYPVQYEVGSYLHYYFNSLGDVVFVESNFIALTKQRGFNLGIFCRLLIPYGDENVKMTAAEMANPPVIYNPRF